MKFLLKKTENVTCQIRVAPHANDWYHFTGAKGTNSLEITGIYKYYYKKKLGIIH